MYMICHPPDPPRYLPSPPLRPQQHLRVRITRQCLRRAPPPCCPFCPHALRSPPSGGRVPSVSRRVPARVTFRLSDHQTTSPCQHRRCRDASDTDLTSTVLGCPPYAPGSTHTAQDRRSPIDAPTRHGFVGPPRPAHLCMRAFHQRRLDTFRHSDLPLATRPSQSLLWGHAEPVEAVQTLTEKKKNSTGPWSSNPCRRPRLTHASRVHWQVTSAQPLLALPKQQNRLMICFPSRSVPVT